MQQAMPMDSSARETRGAPRVTTTVLAAGLARVPVLSASGDGLRVPVSQTLRAPTFPAANSAQRALPAAGARAKVHLQPGHLPLDWAELKRKNRNLLGVDAHLIPLRVTKDMLKSHRADDDCWTAIRGVVYNITPYLDFHPGGRAELLKVAGKDGTLLFDKYHLWVNAERMLEGCAVGRYFP